MPVLDWVGHLVSGLAPAFFLALMLPLLARLLHGQARLGVVRQMLVQLVLGSLVLVAGLILTANDGSMLTYAALVVLSGIAQAWMSRP